MQSDGHQEGRRVAGRYHLLEPIGRGGMGVVWKAHDELLDRTVAVKEVRYSAALGEDVQTLNRRMMREARAAARLTHPNVVVVYDVIEENEQPWIVMQLVPSRSLGQVLREDGPLPPRRVAEIGLALLGALHGAHDAGVLHRDVKPENVLLADNGRVVLTDFGIATLDSENTLTMTGVAGTPAFIAPERLRGLPARRESDLWSLGATLYAAVEGRSPHDRKLPLPTMHSVLTDPPDPARNAGPLLPVLEGLLRKEPVQRLTYEEAAALLRRVAEGRSATQPWTISSITGPRDGSAEPQAAPERRRPYGQAAVPGTPARDEQVPPAARQEPGAPAEREAARAGKPARARRPPRRQGPRRPRPRSRRPGRSPSCRPRRTPRPPRRPYRRRRPHRRLPPRERPRRPERIRPPRRRRPRPRPPGSTSGTSRPGAPRPRRRSPRGRPGARSRPRAPGARDGAPGRDRDPPRRPGADPARDAGSRQAPARAAHRPRGADHRGRRGRLDRHEQRLARSGRAAGAWHGRAGREPLGGDGRLGSPGPSGSAESGTGMSDSSPSPSGTGEDDKGGEDGEDDKKGDKKGDEKKEEKAGGKLPDGWRTHKDSFGFSVGLPKGWKVTKRRGTQVTFSLPSDRRSFLMIEYTDSPARTRRRTGTCTSPRPAAASPVTNSSGSRGSTTWRTPPTGSSPGGRVTARRG
nr:hypothetical protein GCM10020093_115420 [Planobispora longispora]